MKKIILLVAAAIMTAMNVKAQEGYEDTKHEIAISVGAVSNSQWIDIYEDMLTSIVGATYKNEKFSGPFSAEYFYHAKKWLSVGGIFVYGKSTQDLYLSKELSGKIKNTYYTVMPAAKFDWLREKHFGMYSKIGVGATLRNEKVDKISAEKKDYDDSAVHLNWQLSVLGMEVGSPTMRGFIELGTGEQGIVLAGLRCKF